jgi:hypothetical protein
MNTFPSILSSLAATLCLASAQQDPTLINDPPDGSEAPAQKVHTVFRDAEVLETTVTRQGGRDIIVQQLALDTSDPVRPVLPAPPAPVTADPATVTVYDTPPIYFLMLSATVHPGPRTRLRWTHRFPDGNSREYAGWSNIDFNHICNIGTFRATDGKEHFFQMGIGNERFPNETAPEFEDEAPTFIPDGDIPAEALVAVDSLHKIYGINGRKLAAAHAARESARLTKEAELLANPPQPKDLIIRYRIAETPLPTPTEGGAQ